PIGGLVTAATVTVVDTLPPGLNFQSARPPPNHVNGRDYTFNLGTLPIGASTSIQLSTISTAIVPGLVTNTAFVTTTTFEDVLPNNSDSVVSTVGSGIDLALFKTVSPTNLPVGVSNLTYTIVVTNMSTQFISSVVVTDTIPIDVVLVSAIPAVTETNGNRFRFDLGGLGPGASTTIVISAAYTNSIVGAAVTNQANVFTSTQELFLANNVDFAVTTIIAGGPPCVPGVDTDGDGMTDCAELCAGTDPLNSNDFLWVRIDPTGTQSVHRLTFPTVLGHTYWLERSPSLFSNGWNTVVSNLPGLGTPQSLIHTSPTDRVYYRIGVTSP
ncbi:MAG: hypothetical protein AAF492_19055, partial [Verrucomicrobiota bacterium]